MAGETTGVICVALDVEVAGAAVAVSRRGKAPRYFGKSGREEILGTMKSLADLGNQVVCVQEACGFGYCFHRELQAAGVESLVVAPEPLNGRRKTDKRDAGKLCLQLIDWVLREHRDVFKVVRAPSPEQERRRARWRQRSQLLKTRNMLAGHGRGLLQNFGQNLLNFSFPMLFKSSPPISFLPSSVFVFSFCPTLTKNLVLVVPLAGSL